MSLGDAQLASATEVASNALAQRVGGPVLAALESGAVVGAPSGWIDGMVEHLGPGLHAQLHSSLIAEANAVLVTQRLRAAGIESRILKGVATARLDFADPALRVTSDTDVLVPRRALSAAIGVLEDLAKDPGRWVPEWRPGWSDRFGEERSIELASGGWIDVHQLVGSSVGFAIPSAALFADPASFTVADTELAGMSAPMRLLHATLHGWQPGTRLHSLRDVPVLIGRGDVDWREVAALARQWRVDSLMAAGILNAWAALGLGDHPIQRWARDVRPRGLARLTSRVGTLTGAGLWLEALVVLPVRDWLPYVRGPLWPSAEFLDAMGRTRLGQYRRLLGRHRPQR